MTLSIPVFDTDAMRQIADVHPAAEFEMHGEWFVVLRRDTFRTLKADHLAAADHIELLAAALEQARRQP